MRSLGPGTCRVGLLASLLVGFLFSPFVMSQSWATGQYTAPRADFRPLARTDDKTPLVSRGSHYRSVPSLPRHQRLPDITRDRVGSRKAVPITRGQGAGVQFRPDERDPLAEPAGISQSMSLESSDAGFRPIQPRARLSYEELESQRQQTMPSAPTVYPGPAAAPWSQVPMTPWVW